MRKSRLMPLVAGLIALLCAGSTAAEETVSWEDYKNRFLSEDGRIIDYSQGEISHSEGQGYGLLLAWMHGDFDAFDRIRKWTVDNLMVRPDALCAWNWGRRPNGRWGVIDYNNATDGDLLIADALLRAYETRGDPADRDLALRIARDIRERLVVDAGGLRLLLPGYFGFVHPDGIIVNPAYYVFPAFDRLGREDDGPAWDRIETDGLTLLKRAAVPPLNLPPDWARTGDGEEIAVAADKSPHFSYDAVRCPLYLAMDGRKDALTPYLGYMELARRLGRLPEKVNLAAGSVSLSEASAGFHAVFGLCAERLGRRDLADFFLDRAREKIVHESGDYYSNTLYLLAMKSMTP